MGKYHTLQGLALITGGSSGLGYEYARQLAAKGCSLLLVSNREAELTAAAEALSVEFGVKVITRFQDLSGTDAADDLFEWCIKEGLQVDILISNAGMFFYGELNEERYGKAKALLGLHVNTPTRLCVLFGNEMKKRGDGVIISMSSLAAKVPFPGITLYSATKAYLRAFGLAMYHELRPYGVGFTTVCPGAIATPLYGLREDLMKLALRLGVVKTPSWLVRKVLRRAERHKALVQPGLMDNIFLPLVNLVPSALTTRLWVRYRR